MRTCTYCPAPITSSHPATRRCSSAACRRAFNAERGARWQREYRETTGRWRNAELRAEKVASPLCVGGCGRPLKGSRRAAPACRTCAPGVRAREARRTARRARAARKLEVAATGSRGSTVLVAGRCGSCGAGFVGRGRSGGGASYCSRRCSAREVRARRRAAQRGATLTPGRRIEVYERDNWTCRLCDEPVDPAAHYLDDRFPSIDHVVPLARGGVHGPENWQTAHRLCNSIKSDTLAPTGAAA